MADDTRDPEMTGPTQNLPDEQETLGKDTNPMFDRILEELRGLRDETRETRQAVVALDAKVTSLDAKVTSLDARVTSLDARVTSLDTRLRDFKTEMLREFQGLRSNYRQDIVDESRNLQAQIVELSDRVKVLEQRDQPQ